MLPLAQTLNVQDVVFVLPQANMNTWYPQRFIMPRHTNQPSLDSALQLVDRAVTTMLDHDIPHERIVIAGFSQGACLAAEYIARNPQRYGGAVVYSGGLIGTDEEITDYAGDLAQTPVFLGCSDVDFHIPVERVHASTAVFKRLNAQVEERIYPNMAHTINDDELDYLQNLLQSL